MTGEHAGVVQRINEVAPDNDWTHCMLHREALVSKKMSTELNKVLNEAVKIINFIKSGVLNSRLFYKLSEDKEKASSHFYFIQNSDGFLVGNVFSDNFNFVLKC
jgi:hypothetical protein|uniref:SCAN domain-containing protein 3 n=1 Tax=Sipha flava TaxID=143950 RepID=A0A2S2QCF6_9HEMI